MPCHHVFNPLQQTPPCTQKVNVFFIEQDRGHFRHFWRETLRKSRWDLCVFFDPMVSSGSPSGCLHFSPLHPHRLGGDFTGDFGGPLFQKVGMAEERGSWGCMLAESCYGGTKWGLLRALGGSSGLFETLSGALSLGLSSQSTLLRREVKTKEPLALFRGACRF